MQIQTITDYMGFKAQVDQSITVKLVFNSHPVSYFLLYVNFKCKALLLFPWNGYIYFTRET